MNLRKNLDTTNVQVAGIFATFRSNVHVLL